MGCIGFVLFAGIFLFWLKGWISDHMVQTPAEAQALAEESIDITLPETMHWSQGFRLEDTQVVWATERDLSPDDIEGTIIMFIRSKDENARNHGSIRGFEETRTGGQEIESVDSTMMMMHDTEVEVHESNLGEEDVQFELEYQADDAIWIFLFSGPRSTVTADWVQTILTSVR